MMMPICWKGSQRRRSPPLPHLARLPALSSKERAWREGGSAVAGGVPPRLKLVTRDARCKSKKKEGTRKEGIGRGGNTQKPEEFKTR